MQTWVLVITLVVNSRAVGVTSIPGYTSEAACHSAGVVAQNSEKTEGRAGPILLSRWARKVSNSQSARIVEVLEAMRCEHSEAMDL